MPKTKSVSVVRSKDGRYFEIPDHILKQYQIQPHAVPTEERLPLSAQSPGDPQSQWVYRPPEVGASLEWGDDIDPTGGMSSASRRG